MKAKSARRRREIRKRQKERKRTNDAKKAEAKLLGSIEPSNPRTHFVDPVSGSDRNSGLDPLDPLQTIAGALSRSK